MNGVSAMTLGDLNDAGNVQIGAQGAEILSDQIGFVGSGTEDAVCILLGVDGNGLDVKVVAGPEYPHGDFAAVGHQYLLERMTHRKDLLF